MKNKTNGASNANESGVRNVKSEKAPTGKMGTCCRGAGAKSKKS